MDSAKPREGETKGQGRTVGTATQDSLHPALEVRNRRLSVLNALLQIGLEDLHLEEQLSRALDEILSIPWLPLEPKGGIFLTDATGGTLRLTAQRKLAPALQQVCAEVPFGRCLCGRAASNRSIVHASCVDDRHENRYAGMVPHGHYSVPILSGECILGVIVLYLPDGHTSSDDEIEFLESVANTLASTIKRHQADAALKESEEVFRSISTTAQDGIVMLDGKGRVKFWNDAAHSIFGYRPSEANGRDLADLIIPNRYKSRHRKGLAGFQETGEGRVIGRPMELQALHKNRSEIPVELSVSGISRAGEWHAVGIVRDTTRRKRAEDTLRESEERARDFAETTADWFWETGPDLRFTRLAGRYESVLGLKREDILGKRPRDLFASGKRKDSEWERHFPVRGAGRPSVKARITSWFEMPWQRAENGIVTLRVSGTSYNTAAGTCGGYRGAVRDVTERVATMDALRKLSRAVEQSPNLILITDTQGTIEYVNPTFCLATGYYSDEVIGQRPSILQSGLTPNHVYHELWQEIKAGKTWEGELCNRKKTVRFSGMPLPSRPLQTNQVRYLTS